MIDLRRLVITLLLFTLASVTGALSIPTEASAKDMADRLGLGGEVTTTLADSGLSAKYWLSTTWGVQTKFSVGYEPTDIGQNQTENRWDVGLSIRALFAFARAENTNLFGGAGMSFHFATDATQVVDLMLGVEHFFTDYFSISGHVGAHIQFGAEQVAFRLGDVTAWGSGFHFYF